MKTLKTTLSVALLGLSFNIAHAQEDVKGVGVNNDLLIGINSGKLSVSRAVNGELQKVDVNLMYSYSDASGTGKQHKLDNGSSLFSGDKFTISIDVNEDVYVYLYHFDSSGQLNELITMSGYSNDLKAGQKLVLPAPDKHFYLDNKVGTETIHTIVSKVQMNTLKQKYQQKLLSNAMIANTVTKGILIGQDNSNSSTSGNGNSNISSQMSTGRVIECQAADKAACRETFIIKHLAR